MKPRYSLVLLDADSTLFDFPRAEREAFGRTADIFGLPGDDASYALYSSINDGYWHALGLGEITKEQLLYRRFEDFLRAVSAEGSPDEINGIYRNLLGEGYYLLPGAEEVCRELSRHCRLVIATNGVDSTQRSRLAKSPIAPYIEALISSDMAGANKPDPRFFSYLFSHIPPAEKSETLMVGDLLYSDIKGGVDSGLDTCWYNPGHLPEPADLPVTYIIDRLENLTEIVIKGECGARPVAV
ncbi:MAG: YjjG family noncanonical pyrimidine nucleotidase [Oscillospiraceae bacterium]|jgi:YjjG family noncanonical pyrimidine nucleotidase|nr:YjjG family noncanonical pyrimidine nucleotidase [Oscillospiraceae bacterium]